MKHATYAMESLGLLGIRLSKNTREADQRSIILYKLDTVLEVTWI